MVWDSWAHGLAHAHFWDRLFEILVAGPLSGQTPQNSWDKPAFGTSPLLGFTPTYPAPHALAPMLFISGRSIANLPMQSEVEFSIKATTDTKAKMCAGMTGLSGGFGVDDASLMEAPSFVVDLTNNNTPEMADSPMAVSDSLEVEAEEVSSVVAIYPWTVQVVVYGGSRTEGESSEGKHGRTFCDPCDGQSI
jgi:hypothetical protein